MEAIISQFLSLQWRHNESDGVSNHHPHDCFHNCLFRQIKENIKASLAFVRGIHRCPVNSLHKGPVTRKMFPFDDVIMFAVKSKCSKLSHALLRPITTVPTSSPASIADFQFSTMRRSVDWQPHFLRKPDRNFENMSLKYEIICLQCTFSKTLDSIEWILTGLYFIEHIRFSVSCCNLSKFQYMRKFSFCYRIIY